MADYFRSSSWRKLTENDIPRIADALQKIAKTMQESDVREARKFKIEEKILLTKLKTEKNKLNEQNKADTSN
jgi:hypothetical protein